MSVVYFAGDAVQLAESTNDLQRLLHAFVTIAKNYSMMASVQKAKTIVITKEPITNVS